MTKRSFTPLKRTRSILNTEKKGIKCSFKNLMLLKNWYIPLYRNVFMHRDRLWQREPAVLLLSHASGFPVFLLSLTSKVPHSKTIGLLSNLLRIVSFLLQSCLSLNSVAFFRGVLSKGTSFLRVFSPFVFRCLFLPTSLVSQMQGTFKKQPSNLKWECLIRKQ